MFDQIHRILGKTRGKTQCETFIIWIRRKKEVKCKSKWTWKTWRNEPLVRVLVYSQALKNIIKTSDLWYRTFIFEVAVVMRNQSTLSVLEWFSYCFFEICHYFFLSGTIHLVFMNFSPFRRNCWFSAASLSLKFLSCWTVLFFWIKKISLLMVLLFCISILLLIISACLNRHLGMLMGF